MCLTVWLSIIISIVFNNIYLLGLIYLLLRIVDFILEKITFKSNTK